LVAVDHSPSPPPPSQVIVAPFAENEKITTVLIKCRILLIAFHLKQ